MVKKKAGRPKDKRKTYPKKTEAKKAAERKGTTPYKVKGGWRVRK